MATEIAILNIRMPEATLPQIGEQISYMTWALDNDDVARMIGDGWQPLSHQILAAPGDGLMVSLLCVRTARADSLDLPPL